jgi:6-pyruvoyltetrahydropterin/6-carboxytetrahydropterin synthase
VTGPIVDTSGHSSEGMVVDFSVLKSLMVTEIADKWDHAMLVWKNDPLIRTLTAFSAGIVELSCIPTAENLAALTYTTLVDPLGRRGLTLTRVRLYETPNCWADYTP